MNRRQLLRTAIGAGAAAASLPVLAKIAEANTNGCYATGSSPICNAPEWKEPPLDMRTPEQVVEDSRTDWAKSTIRDFRSDYTKYRKNAYNVPRDVFQRTHEILIGDNAPFELRLIEGRECLIVNGNVLSVTTTA